MHPSAFILFLLVNYVRPDRTKDKACAIEKYDLETFDLEPYTTVILKTIKENIGSICCNAPLKEYNVTQTSEISKTRDWIFTFPVLASAARPKSGDRKAYKHLFIPMLDPPGAFYISVKQQINITAIIDRCLELWPLVLFAIFMSVVAGFIEWVLETRSNTEEFPAPFFRGWFEGIWWSVISMTTVGYGDKSPRTIGGRIFAILWIMVGIVVFCILAGELTTVIFEAKTGDEHSVVGKKVGTFDRLYDQSLVGQCGGFLHSMDRRQHKDEVGQLYNLTDQLHKGTIDGILMDKYTYRDVENKLKSCKYPNPSVLFFLNNTVLTDISNPGDDLNYGILVQQKYKANVHTEFATTLDNNRLAFQSQVSLMLHTSSEMEAEEDDGSDFYERVFVQNVLIVALAVVFVLVLGGVYEVRRCREVRKRNEEYDEQSTEMF